MKGREGRGCPGGRRRLQIGEDRPLLPNPPHLSPEHRDGHPRLCPPAPPALLPRCSRHIVLWVRYHIQINILALFTANIPEGRNK